MLNEVKEYWKKFRGECDELIERDIGGVIAEQIQMTDRILEMFDTIQALRQETDIVKTQAKEQFIDNTKLRGKLDNMRQENERLQAQNAVMRAALEEATETIENIYEKDTPQTEKYRDILNVGTTEYHNPADMEALKQAREALKGVNVVRCPYCWGKETHSDKCEISKAIENIDKAIGGKEDA